MSRSFISYATRWMAIGVISIFAIGGLPAIAAACEGAGEETAEGVVEAEETGKDSLFIENKKGVEVEITMGVTKFEGRGTITSEGTCKLHNRVAAGARCEFKQDDPIGAFVKWAPV